MNKLFVAGCSISDRTQVTHSYGDFVAADLGVEFVNLAGGAGSNKRCIRLVVEQVRAGNLTPDDLLIFQWIEPARTELHSPTMMFTEQGKAELEANKQSCEHNKSQVPEGFVGRVPCSNPIFDIVAGKYPVTKFKPGSAQWLSTTNDVKYHAAREELGTINELTFYEMTVQYELLEGYLKSKNIPFISLWRHDLGLEIVSHIRNLFNIELRRENDIVLDEIWPEYGDPNWFHERNKKFWLDPDDSVHFSIEGHIEVAKHVVQHLKHKGLA